MVTVLRFYSSLSFQLNTEKNPNEKKKKSCPHYLHITAWMLIVRICIVHKMYRWAGLSGCLASVKEVLVWTTQHMLVIAFLLQLCLPVNQRGESSWFRVAFMLYSKCSKNWLIPTSSELWFLRSNKISFPEEKQKRQSCKVIQNVGKCDNYKLCDAPRYRRIE